MTIYLGCDHKGFGLKEHLKQSLTDKKFSVVDCGSHTLVDGDDYPDIAFEVGKRVSHDMEGLGIVICGSGTGVQVATGKVVGVRCVLGFSPLQVAASRHDDDCNVLAIGSDFIAPPEAESLVDSFLLTPYAKEERFERRLRKITAFEMGLSGSGCRDGGCCGGGCC
jgi:ribose 5-phosphate isomerase B